MTKSYNSDIASALKAVSRVKSSSLVTKIVSPCQSDRILLADFHRTLWTEDWPNTFDQKFSSKTHWAIGHFKLCPWKLQSVDSNLPFEVWTELKGHPKCECQSQYSVPHCKLNCENDVEKSKLHPVEWKCWVIVGRHNSLETASCKSSPSVLGYQQIKSLCVGI